MKTNIKDTVLYDTRKDNETINTNNIKTLYDIAANCISEKGIIANDNEITKILTKEIDKKDIRRINNENDKTLALCNKYVNVTADNFGNQKSRDDYVKELYIKLQINNDTEYTFEIHNEMYSKITEIKEKLCSAISDVFKLEGECHIWLQQNLSQNRKHSKKDY